MNLFDDVETIVLKFGTAIITSDDQVNHLWIRTKVKEMASLMKKGKKIILVSSGAVAAGMHERGLKKRPANIFELQLLSGIGQPLLFKLYKDLFYHHGFYTAQILLTHHNFQTPRERLNIQKILNQCLSQGIVPVINTNDIITNEELMKKASIKFSDNDQLAALVAKNLNSDLLLIVTNVEGLYSKMPKRGQSGELIDVIPKVTRAVELMASHGKSDLGLGGMISKVRVAKDVAGYGIPTIIAHGKYNLQDILTHKAPRTLFTAEGI